MKARVLLTQPQAVIALEPDDEGDRRVLERLLRGGVVQVSLPARGGRDVEHVMLRPALRHPERRPMANASRCSTPSQKQAAGDRPNDHTETWIAGLDAPDRRCAG